jgi:hypothetical protein
MMVQHGKINTANHDTIISRTPRSVRRRAGSYVYDYRAKKPPSIVIISFLSVYPYANQKVVSTASLSFM